MKTKQLMKFIPTHNKQTNAGNNNEKKKKFNEIVHFFD